ncbi:Holliday junction branch migration protein RuvA [Geoalkalibacter sp.]|uniref:Holliday junction branch migration protein RuvA n=1 Tax=Geoalkalibacter sp. TaxID=3041440 RepID=UPI00272EB926|nr:Holliday junction branch migration protein RuvA [Geoalkalibacter sp.]
MIALLTGKLAYKSLDHVIVDVGGVGYRVTVPLSTFYKLPDEGVVQLRIHTSVKEDAIALYGFLTNAEKEMFALLLGVSGVGPKLAVNILSNIEAADLRAALARADIRRLSAVPGIGKKTAERLSLELKDKVQRLAPLAADAQPPQDAEAHADSLDDVLSALVNLGYKDVQARKVLESLEIAPGAGLEDILKGALKILMK